MLALIRVKRRNAAAPDAIDEEFPLCIICTCKLGHKKFAIKWERGGVASSVEGNTLCWFSLFEYIVQGLAEDSDAHLLRHWNQTEKTWGKKLWSYDKIQKSMALWADYCGIDGEIVNNCWARKSYRTNDAMIVTIFVHTRGGSACDDWLEGLAAPCGERHGGDRT